MSLAPPKTPSETQRRNNSDGMETSDPFESAPEESCCVSEAQQKIHVAFEKCEKPRSNGHCCVVADENLKKAGVERCDHCGKSDGVILPFAYDGRQADLHPGCREAWIAMENDNLAIPPYLDRRAELSTWLRTMDWTINGDG